MDTSSVYSNGLRNLYYCNTGGFFNTSNTLGNASACPSPPALLGDLYHRVIKNGVVVYPEDWIVVNREVAPERRYAGVVECRDADGIRIPHFLFFTNRQYAREYTEQEIAQINRLCAHASQIFARVQEMQVKPVPDPDHPGRYLNEKEYLDAPQIGYFALYEQGDPAYPSDYDPPYGAKIIRN